MNTIRYCLLAVLLFTLMRLRAQNENPYPPTRFPDRIALNVTEDPSTAISLNWRTSPDITDGYIEILPAVSDPALTKNAPRTRAVTESFELRGIHSHFHSAVVKSLTPNTLYMYRVGSGEHWSEWFHIRTAGKAGEKFSFIYMGDVQQGMRSFWPRMIREAYLKAPDARLVMYAGDIVNRGLNDHEWGELFYGGGFIHGSIPAMPSPGNHEHADNAEGVNVITPLWRAQYNLPENGPAGLEETVYFTDIQGVRFISLNSQEIWFGNEKMQRQIEWLHQVLSNNPNKWTIITFHHPVHSVSARRDNKNLREKFQPIFEQYKVDMVLQGHDHAYARGMKNVPMPEGLTGTTASAYVVSMCGSKMYNNESNKWMDKLGTNVQLYQIITVDGNKLLYRCYTATGELFDAFDLVKRKGKNNKMVEIK